MRMTESLSEILRVGSPATSTRSAVSRCNPAPASKVKDRSRQRRCRIEGLLRGEAGCIRMRSSPCNATPWAVVGLGESVPATIGTSAWCTCGSCRATLILTRLPCSDTRATMWRSMRYWALSRMPSHPRLGRHARSRPARNRGRSASWISSGPAAAGARRLVPASSSRCAVVGCSACFALAARWLTSCAYCAPDGLALGGCCPEPRASWSAHCMRRRAAQAARQLNRRTVAALGRWGSDHPKGSSPRRLAVKWTSRPSRRCGASVAPGQADHRTRRDARSARRRCSSP